MELRKLILQFKYVPTLLAFRNQHLCNVVPLQAENICQVEQVKTKVTLGVFG